MYSLNVHVKEYTEQLNKEHIQKAYRGIMAFMSDLKSYLEKKYPNYGLSALYLGYMDMTYFAFTPSDIKSKKLKIAVVYLHKENRFELWLAASNRHVQAEYIKNLENKNIGSYSLSQIRPGVDSIIESIIVASPDFDNTDELKIQIEEKTVKFIKDITSILK